MQAVLIVVAVCLSLVIVSCGERSQNPTIDNPATKIYSKAVGEGIAYHVLSQDSFNVYTERFAKVVTDSSSEYALKYAKSFRYLVNKKKVPSEWQIKAEMRNAFIEAMKD